jgi:AcrR family transcriptional regulator
MPRKTDARDKALDTAEHLFRTQGVAATGLAQIIAESGSPKGSFYFHFQGGKDQLATEVAQRFAAKGLVAIKNASAATSGNSADFIALLCAGFAAEMRGSGFALGCALQNIATEKAPADPAITAVLKDGFEAWIAAIADHLASCRVAEPHSTATALVAALEGARTLARVQGSDAVFRAIADRFTRELRSA